MCQHFAEKMINILLEQACFPSSHGSTVLLHCFFSLSHDKTSEILLLQQKLAACSVVSERSVIMSNWDSDVGNKGGDTRKALQVK